MVGDRKAPAEAFDSARGFPFSESPASRRVLPARTAAAVAAAAAAATAAAVFAGLRLVDGQRAPADFPAVELRDGGLTLLLGRHLDEAEAARAARVAVFDDRRRLDRTGLREQFLQVAARSL